MSEFFVLWYIWIVIGSMVSVIVFYKIDIERTWNKRNIAVFVSVLILSGPFAWTLALLYIIVGTLVSLIGKVMK